MCFCDHLAFVRVRLKKLLTYLLTYKTYIFIRFSKEMIKAVGDRQSAYECACGSQYTFNVIMQGMVEYVTTLINRGLFCSKIQY